MLHAKTDSEVTSLAPSSPARSPPRQPIYYATSPNSSRGASPLHHHHRPSHHRYASPHIHHSRESFSTTRLSESLAVNGYWRKIPGAGAGQDGGLDDGGIDDEELWKSRTPAKCYAAAFVLGFAALFSLFSLILWTVSRQFKPDISVESVVFETYNMQAGVDPTGVATEMLTINSTVRIAFRNPSTFFAVHVSFFPVELFYYDLRVATGHVDDFYQRRRSGRVVAAAVSGVQIPVYGGGASLSSRSSGGGEPAKVQLRLEFAARARAHVLGRLVRSEFFQRARCSMLLQENHLGRPLKLGRNSCVFHG